MIINQINRNRKTTKKQSKTKTIHKLHKHINGTLIGGQFGDFVLIPVFECNFVKALDLKGALQFRL